jgi:hypothetical protein
MVQLMTTRLRQFRVVVAGVEPLQLPILVGVDQLVRQVLHGGICRMDIPRPTTQVGTKTD